MDIVALASSVTTVLGPLLPYLLKAGAEETGKAVAGQSWEWAKLLWTKLKPTVEANPAALVAAQDVAQAPEDHELQTVLRVQLRKLLTEDQSLADEVSRWLEQGKAAGIMYLPSASAALRLAAMPNATRSSPAIKQSEVLTSVV